MRALTFSLLFLCASAWAGEFSSWKKYTSARLIAEEASVYPGQKLSIGFDVRLLKGWHTYWINPGDSGSAVKLSISAKSGEKHFDLLTGPILFPVPERMESGPITSFVYNNQVLFMSDIVVPDSLAAGGRLNLRVDAEWLVCEDVCIPAIDTYELNLPVRKSPDVQPSSNAEAFTYWRGRLPRMETTPVDEKRSESSVELAFAKPSDYAKYQIVNFFPLRGSHLSNARPAVVSDTAKEVRLKFEPRAVGERRAGQVGLLMLSNGADRVALQWGDPNYGFMAAEAAKPKTEPPPMAAIAWILFSAFLGGLILNLMPCVFPILSIKLLAIAKQSGQSHAEVRTQNFTYVAGVVSSFVVVGLVLTLLRGAGHLIGWGFQLQSPVFVMLLAWLFFVLAVQMLGYFEIEWLNPNIGHKLTKRGGRASAFFTGVLAVVVASPCTAPFMGAALGFAISQSPFALLAVCMIMGVGLAFPYLVFGIFPEWSRFLPKPGAWMQTIKELMAFPLLLASVWLVWLLAQLKGNLAVGVVLTGMVGWFFVLWMKNKRAWLAYIIGAIIMYSAVQVITKLPEVRSEGHVNSGELTWVPYSESALRREPNQTVFLDFTADWCLTCKLNEKLVFTRPEIVQLLKQNGVRLVTGDWTRQDPEITKFLNNYRRVGVPFYIAFGPGAPEGRIFPEVLTPDIFKREIQEVMKAKGGSQ